MLAEQHLDVCVRCSLTPLSLDGPSARNNSKGGAAVCCQPPLVRA